MRLNLGCGMDYRDGYLNVDGEVAAKADVHADIERRWYWAETNGVTEIIARHVLEHLHDLRTFFSEAYRVMQPGALMRIDVPHHCSDFFWGDPTHVRPITHAMLTLLSRKACEGFIRDKLANTPLAIYWGVDFEVQSTEAILNDRWIGRLTTVEEANEAMEMYNNVASEVKFVLRRM